MMSDIDAFVLDIMAEEVAREKRGERRQAFAKDLASSAGSGFVRGAVGLTDLISAGPRAVDSLLAKGAEAVFGEGNAPEWTQRPAEYNKNNPPPGRALVEGGNIGRAALSYEPKTTAGEFAQTTAEFIPGSIVGSSSAQMLSKALRFGALPGLASEAAGQATEDTFAEPYARVAAPIVTAMMTAPRGNVARPLVPRADPEDAKNAETLMRSGVYPTVGQVTKNPTLRMMEDSLDLTSGQSEAFTKAAMRTTGSKAARAVPETLRATERAIVKQMDDAVAGIAFVPDAALATRAQQVVASYLEDAPSGQIVGRLGKITDELVDYATSPDGKQVTLDQLKKWRSSLRSMLLSKDPATRDAAFEIRNIIDDATESQLIAAGRADDAALLSDGRVKYRNFLGVSDASTRAGAEDGLLSTTGLRGSTIRTQGRRNAAIGRTTELDEIARAGAGTLRPEASVKAGGVRSISPELGSMGFGAYAGTRLMPDNPLMGGVIGGIAGAGGVNAGQALMRSRPVQNALMDPATIAMQLLMRTAPGASIQGD